MEEEQTICIPVMKKQLKYCREWKNKFKKEKLNWIKKENY